MVVNMGLETQTPLPQRSHVFTDEELEIKSKVKQYILLARITTDEVELESRNTIGYTNRGAKLINIAKMIQKQKYIW